MKKTAGLLFVVGVLAFAPMIVLAQEQPAVAVSTPVPVAKPAWMAYQDPYVGEQNNLNNPHRTTEEIIAYAQMLVTDGLNLKPDDFNQHVAGMKKNFSDHGWGDYANYLKESRLADMVRVDKYNVSTIINGAAMVATQGANEGHYEWQINAPIMMTFLQDDGSGKLREVNTGRFKIAMVLARVAPNGEMTEGLQIRSWRVESVSSNE